MSKDLKTDAAVVALQPEVNKLTEFADTVVITTAAQYEIAAAYLMTIKGLLQKIEDARTRITKPLNESLRETNKQAKEASAPLTAAEAEIKEAMGEYSDEQDRIRREEQAKVDAAARVQQDKLQQQAAKALASGKVERAEMLETRASTVVAPVIQREAPRVSGISTREVWKGQCTDLKALVKAIAEGRAALSLVMANDKVIGAQARNLKAEFVADGVRVWSEKQIAAGSAA